MNNILNIKDLCVSFDTDEGRISAVRDLSLSIGQGEVFAIVGESGCGKSVLCKSIMGILPRSAHITHGSIEICGRETTGLTDEEYCRVRAEDISMIFQDPMTSLDPTYTIGDQIAEAVTVHESSLSGEALKRRVVELMDLVGIDRADERYSAYPWMLSGGMRQRCVLAMALSQEPKLLIADEPTTALDVTIQAEILDMLTSIRDRTDMSVLFITHDLGVVARIADKVAIMYAGRIVEQGNCDEIYKDPVHPYTWGLLHALPAYAENGRLFPIPGTPPVLKEDFKGDAFAPRNIYALGIDYVENPPFFEISGTHKAATWLADDRAPKIEFGFPEDEKTRGAEQKKIHSDYNEKPLVEVCDLTHYFKLSRKTYVKAVSHVSFDIRRGEVFALVGESGSGKSTIARCMLGLYKPFAGRIIYDGTDITDRKRSGEINKRLAREIQFISQDPGASLDRKMSVRDIIAEPLKIHKVYRNKRETDEHIKELLREVNIDESFMDRYPPELSGGQRQRVSIARAYGMDPKLLVADEPLASLDVSIQAQIVEIFSSLRKEHDTAMFFIAHDLSMVEFLSDRVGVMYKGHMVELADTADLFRDPQHEYTRSLLRAAPRPDPDTERNRSIERYTEAGDSLDHGAWEEVSPGHFVLRKEGA